MNKIFFVHYKKILKLILPLVISAAFFVSKAIPCHADGTMLSDFSAELLFQQDFHSPNAIIQSVCVDENYICTIENVADDPSIGDVISAYYKNTTDENGNPVEQYSLARSDDTQHLEHGNGLTYNPNTNQLIEAPYTSLDPQNRGCLITIDPSTLQITGRIKISDSYNILSVSYDRVNDVYYIQTNDEGSYSIYKLNSDFQIIEELGPEDPSPGYNFQAFCIADGYILQSPLTMYLTESNYLMAYSVSGRDVVDCVTVDFGLQGFVKREPEQIARLDDTGFIVAMNGTREDGSGTVFFYKITFPYFQPSDPLFASDESSTQIQPEQTTVVQPASKTANSEVKITRLQDLIVGKSSRELNKKHESSALTYIIPVIAAAVFSWYINIVRIKRKRKRKDEHIRQLRTNLQMRIERELKESLSDEDWYDDF